MAALAPEDYEPPEMELRDPATLIEDQMCFHRTLRAFSMYQKNASAVMAKRRADWEAGIPASHRALLAAATGGGPSAIFEQQQRCMQANQALLDRIVAEAGGLYESYWPPEEFQAWTETQRADGAPTAEPRPKAIRGQWPRYYRPRSEPAPQPTPLDCDKVHGTLRQMVRDWSSEGAAERDQIFPYFLETLTTAYPDPATRNHIKILVPGGGLSRLAVELAARGFHARGNEFSFHMLIAGNFIMNKLHHAGQVTIHPYCDATCNQWSRASQHRGVAIPDRSAYEMFEEATAAGVEPGMLAMVAGDFIEVYSKPSEAAKWHAVASCFFLDTAKNIVEYLEVIWNALVPGGLLINVGPLLFHWSDTLEEVSIEITFEEVQKLMQLVGFEIVHSQPIRTTYTDDVASMKHQVFQCPAFTARKGVKPPPPAPAAASATDAAAASAPSSNTATASNTHVSGGDGSTAPIPVGEAPQRTGNGRQGHGNRTRRFNKKH